MISQENVDGEIVSALGGSRRFYIGKHDDASVLDFKIDHPLYMSNAVDEIRL